MPRRPTLAVLDPRKRGPRSGDRITRAEWRRMTPYEKGYACYMLGAHPDQPNVPEEYRPRSAAARAEFTRGAQVAMLTAQDCP